MHVLQRHEAGSNPWPDTIRQATAYCLEHELGLLVVDVFDKWAPLGRDDENSSGATVEVLAPLLEAAGAGLAVLLVTHQRKSGGEYGEAVRGSNALTGAVDVVVELERPSRSLLAGDGARVLRAVSRFSSTPEELVVSLGDDGYTFVGDTAKVKAEGERTLVLEQLDVEPQASADLAEAVGLPESTVRRHLAELMDEGLAARDGEGKRGNPYRWGKPPSGLEGTAGATGTEGAGATEEAA